MASNYSPKVSEARPMLIASSAEKALSVAKSVIATHTVLFALDGGELMAWAAKFPCGMFDGRS